MSDNRTAECTLSNEQLVKQVGFWVSSLCKSNGDAWTLRVPPDPNYDPDMVITELILRFEKNASQQTASLREELQRVYELVKKWHNQSDANEQCWKETVKDYNAQREVNKSLREENERLQQWKESMLKIWGPVIDWGQSKEAGLRPGTDITKELVRRAKEYKQLQEEVERLRGEIGIANVEARTQRARAIGLLEDVDRLTEIIKEAITQNPHSHTYKILMQYKALSGKESKPS